jgi:hypothetical protein
MNTSTHVMKLDGILTCFHQKLWLPTKENSVTAFIYIYKILPAVKPQMNCKLKLACWEICKEKTTLCLQKYTSNSTSTL